LHPTLIFSGKKMTLTLEWSIVTDLPTNIRPRWKMAVANTLAYFDTATITAVISFLLQGTEQLSIIYVCCSWQQLFL
jgi:hypothetical protein